MKKKVTKGVGTRYSFLQLQPLNMSLHPCDSHHAHITFYRLIAYYHHTVMSKSAIAYYNIHTNKLVRDVLDHYIMYDIRAPTAFIIYYVYIGTSRGILSRTWCVHVPHHDDCRRMIKVAYVHSLIIAGDVSGPKRRQWLSEGSDSRI